MMLPMPEGRTSSTCSMLPMPTWGDITAAHGASAVGVGGFGRLHIDCGRRGGGGGGPRWPPRLQAPGLWPDTSEAILAARYCRLCLLAPRSQQGFFLRDFKLDTRQGSPAQFECCCCILTAQCQSPGESVPFFAVAGHSQTFRLRLAHRQAQLRTVEWAGSPQ